MILGWGIAIGVYEAALVSLGLGGNHFSWELAVGLMFPWLGGLLAWAALTSWRVHVASDGAWFVKSRFGSTRYHAQDFDLSWNGGSAIGLHLTGSRKWIRVWRWGLPKTARRTLTDIVKEIDRRGFDESRYE